jgi:hypothetical protein
MLSVRNTTPGTCAASEVLPLPGGPNQIAAVGRVLVSLVISASH